MKSPQQELLPMKLWRTTLLLTCCLALAASAGAWAQTLDEAARQAARQYDAKVLSAQTVQEGQEAGARDQVADQGRCGQDVRIPVREN